jgi:hypothetical protein
VNPPARIIAIFGVLVAVAVAAVLVVSGGRPGAQQDGSPRLSFPPAPPTKWDLTTPEKAVRSYLAWTSYSYRMANSDLGTPTMEPTETVRVDSYIQLNREQGKGIDQKLTKLEVRSTDVKGDLATIKTYEEWDYAYFSMSEPTRSISPHYTAKYDVAYRLKRGKDGLWRVDKVDAKPQGEVK